MLLSLLDGRAVWGEVDELTSLCAEWRACVAADHARYCIRYRSDVERERHEYPY